MSIPEENITNFKIVNHVLKECVQKGLSIFQIGKIIYRSGYGERESILEDIVKKAKAIYKDVHGDLYYCRVDSAEPHSDDSSPSTANSSMLEESSQCVAPLEHEESFFKYLSAFLEQEILL